MNLHKAKPIDLRAASDFAAKMFTKWPKFKPTCALYIDFEGSGTEHDERILSMYWPQLPSRKRFHMLWRGHNAMDVNSLLTELKKLRCDPDKLEHIVVFSGGKLKSDEQERFEEFFGKQIFPAATWVNMHLTMRSSKPLRKSVRKSAWSKPKKNKKLIPNNLENLEHQFGYKRAPELRSHDNEYQDGSNGQMTVLKMEQQAFASKSLNGFKTLKEYCEWDVQSMFRIARWCETKAGKKIRSVTSPPARTNSSTNSNVKPKRVKRWSAQCVGTTAAGRQCRNKGISSSATGVKAYCPLHRNQASSNFELKPLSMSTPRDCFYPDCDHKFLKVNKHGKLFSQKQRNLQLGSHLKKEHSDDDRLPVPVSVTAPKKPALEEYGAAVPLVCPICDHEFLKVNKHGKLFSQKQRYLQLGSHLKKEHSEDDAKV